MFLCLVRSYKLSFQTASQGEIWKRRVHKTYKMFFVHTTPEKVKTQQSPVFRRGKLGQGSHDYRDIFDSKSSVFNMFFAEIEIQNTNVYFMNLAGIHLK